MEDVPKDRQTLLFSATIPPAVERLAQRILHDPKGVTIGKPLGAAKSVEQRLIWMREESKNRELRRLLREEKGSIMVFTRSKDGATRVFRALHSAGFYDVTYIHSDRRQSDREQALAEFKSGKYRILIATDVAGRGIHVDAVAHVINYDLPMEAEDYVHRIGRTGRLDATGRATSFVTSRDRALVRRIEKLVGNPIHADFADPFEKHLLEEKKDGTHGHGRGHGHGQSRGHAKQAHGPAHAKPAAEAPTADGTGAPGKRRRRRRGGRGRRGKGGGSGGSPPTASG
jgi:ATP-dependent RNA helicase RhlE